MSFAFRQARNPLGAACDGVALRTQIFGEIFLHLRGRWVRHGVEMREQLWKQMDAVLAHGPGGFVAVLVILEPVFDRKSGHPDVNARFRWIASWIEPNDRRMLQDSRIQQNDVDIVVKFF